MRPVFPKMVIVLGAILLAGCASVVKPDLIATKNVVHMPPPALFACPSTPLPATFKDNRDVAILLVQEHNNAAICQQHLKAVQQDLQLQQGIIGSK